MKTLTKEHGLLTIQGTELNWDIVKNGTYGSWRSPAPGGTTFISSTYFDLAGMSMEEKTLFFDAAGAQTVSPPKATNGAAGDNVLIYDIMAASPMTDTQLINFSAFGNFNQPGANLSFDETIYARSQLYGLTINEAGIDIMLLLNEEQFGSLSPTASDRVYSYRMVIVLGVASGMTGTVIYPVRHILRATAKEEPDHEYIMRLLRSYQLQQEPDED